MDHPFVGRWKRTEDPFRYTVYLFRADGTGRRLFEAPGIHSDTAVTWRLLGPDQVEIHFGRTESSEDGEEDQDDWDRTDVYTFVIEGDTLTLYRDPRWPSHYTRQAAAK